MRCRAQASGEGAPAAPPLITGEAAGHWRSRPLLHRQRQLQVTDPAPCLVTAEADLDALVYAARLADSSAGETQPHPNSACVIHNRNGALVAEAFLWAQVRHFGGPGRVLLLLTRSRQLAAGWP